VILAPFILRRLKEEVAKELIPKAGGSQKDIHIMWPALS